MLEERGALRIFPLYTYRILISLSSKECYAKINEFSTCGDKFVDWRRRVQEGGRVLIREIIESLGKSAGRERGGDFYRTGKRDHGAAREREREINIFCTGDR